MEGGPARWRKVSDAVAGFLRADGKLAPIYALRFANASRAEQNHLPPIQDLLLNVEYYRKTGIEYPSRMDQVQIAN